MLEVSPGLRMLTAIFYMTSPVTKPSSLRGGDETEEGYTQLNPVLAREIQVGSGHMRAGRSRGSSMAMGSRGDGGPPHPPNRMVEDLTVTPD